tara:strand:- start:43 stop:813 length:771 start_codon:yes stop_codon:yes gene_type:complete
VDFLIKMALNLTNVKLLICTPCYGGMCTEGYMMSIVKLMAELSNKGITAAVKTIGNESLISRARNALSSDFLRSDFTHLLFIDSDIEFEPIQVLRLLINDKPISCAAYPIKNINYRKIGYNLHTKPDKLSDPEYIKSSSVEFATHIKNPEVKKGWFKTEYAATGFLLIKNHVFQKILQDNPQIRYRNEVSGYGSNELFEFFPVGIDPETRHYLSEDYYFSKLAIKSGFDIWCDAKSKLNHIGTHKYEGDLNKYLTK